MKDSFQLVDYDMSESDSSSDEDKSCKKQSIKPQQPKITKPIIKQRNQLLLDQQQQQQKINQKKRVVKLSQKPFMTKQFKLLNKNQSIIDSESQELEYYTKKDTIEKKTIEIDTLRGKQKLTLPVATNSKPSNNPYQQKNKNMFNDEAREHYYYDVMREIYKTDDMINKKNDNNEISTTEDKYFFLLYI